MWRAFDYKCKNEKCIAYNKKEEHLVDDKDREEPLCPECKQLMERQIGSIGSRHISWSLWRV